MKKLIQLCLLSFMMIGLSSNTGVAQDCCGNPLDIHYEPLDCGEFRVCLEGYEGCPVTDIWTFGLPQVVWPIQDNCITLSGFTPGENLTFYVQVGVTGCSNYFEKTTYEVSDFGCGPDICCDVVIGGDPEPTGECGEFEVCLTGLDNCAVTAIIPSINSSGTANYSVSGNCVTFSGANVGDVINYDITVQIDGCDDVTLQNTYTVTDIGCDPCCLPLDINDATFNQIPGWNWLRICLPKAPCPDLDNFLYTLTFLELCGEEPGIWSTTSSNSQCLYLRFKPCCEYRFRVGYYAPDCGGAVLSQEYIWQSPCDGSSSESNQDVETNPYQVRQASPTTALVSPNPFASEFQVQFAAEKEEAYQLVIYDVQGKIIVQKKGQLSKGQNNIRVEELQNMPSGSYFYELISENHRIYDQLIKN